MFKASLPPIITNERKRKQDDVNGKTNDRNNDRNKDVWKKNPNIIPEWKLRPGENFRHTFHQHRDKCPYRTGSTVPLCVKLQACDGCFEGCPFDHEKINRNNTAHTKSQAFFTGCR